MTSGTKNHGSQRMTHTDSGNSVTFYLCNAIDESKLIYLSIYWMNRHNILYKHSWFPDSKLHSIWWFLDVSSSIISDYSSMLATYFKVLTKFEFIQ